MGELVGTSPCAGVLPLTIGDVQAVEVELGHLTSIAPFAGQATAASVALEAAHGMPLPKANCTTGKEGARAIWFGRDMALLAGPTCDPAVAKHAALTDQSDAWAAVTLSGPSAEDVLARLVPVDLRSVSFKRGHTARTLLKHMNGSVTRLGPESFLILVFRSMARTLAHDLKEAMEAVAARG
ncbi:sarcosine oxidase subunit gamma [Roseobacter sinensis]|uniref:Sarcosine oxidase subunit gamma n=1 Tax=Roseobacter sinensis TaxID=2931391 RepID=A0ABT3BHM0_9RHOB|nr:sarcosine oxidase subunit gamma [Roseobacter sp. WL0113]MCV3272609.1 sarcosine oxidase subunit gamma [Roseobacter sp. WL0113]